MLLSHSKNDSASPTIIRGTLFQHWWFATVNATATYPTLA